MLWLFIQLELYNICPFTSGLLHLAQCFQGTSMYQNVIPFHGRIIAHCIDKSHLIYPFIYWRMLGLFSPFGYISPFGCIHFLNNAAMNIVIQESIWIPIFSSLGSMLRSEIAKSYGGYIFNLLRNNHVISTALHHLHLH